MPRPTNGLIRLLAVVACCAAWTANAEELPVTEQARELMNHSHWKRARALVEAGLREHPDDPGLLSAMADVHATFGDLDDAQTVGERAVRLAPHDAQAHESLAEVYGERASRSGPIRALSYAGKFRKQAEAAIADQPDRLEARYVLMVFYLEAPRIAGGDHRKARDYAEQIAAIDSAMGELARAEVAIQAHDTLAVEARYRRAVDLAPHSVRARMALAGWAAAPWRGQWELAETQARAASEAEPDRSAPYALLAWLYAHLGRWASLDSLLAEADVRCPDDRNPWYQAGRALLADDREPERAERCFRRYVEIEAEPRAPDLAHGHWRLAQALEKLDRRDEAVAELRESLRLEPGFDAARRELKRLKN